MSFSIVSYNVLADSYIRPSYYPSVSALALAPERRHPLLCRRILGYEADVMCLQEVEPRVLDLIEAELGPLGYAASYAMKRGRPDGCATVVKRGVGEVETRTLHFDDGRGTEPASGDVALLLVARAPGGPVGIANTHLRWDPPGTPSEEQVGYRQARELLAALRLVDGPDVPWVICGDFNAGPGSERIVLFEEAGFVDVYREHGRAFTCASNRKAKRIDFILHSGALTSQPLDIPMIADDTALPRDDEPSDHLAIGARIGLREG